MKKLLAGLTIAMAVFGNAYAQSGKPASEKPTIVLVHGAFADASSWNGVVKILEKDGYSVVAAANPLRGVASDAQYVADIVSGIASPVVLVGHSYGGSVVSEAAEGHANVKALVYVAAFAPDVGETAAGLSGKFPGSTLGPTLAPPVPLSGGGKDLYIQQDKFRDQFAADVSVAEAKLMAAGQRPITEAALNEAQTAAAWKKIPNWFIYGGGDKNIPPEALAFMAARAHSRDTVVVKGASHVVMVSNPEPVARLIEKAAKEASR
ncbi:alpha/beta hydrolase [Mesorhizobium sp. M00.F.Ca.ET.151.01.1.1]|nr:alpha/beta hydrolase [Mesorhizobium sp. M00.F.Ca.ET.151.01.1.1]